MAEALIKIKDIENGEIELEVRFSPGPEIDNNSPSHQMVAEFIKLHGLTKVEQSER